MSFLFFLVLGFSQAWAFDVYPEYQGISESALDQFERPADLDGEYQSLVSAYDFPVAMNEEWLAQRQALQFSVGSLTNKHFLLYNRLKVERDWSRDLRFRFIYFSQRDREVDQSRHVLELSQRVLPWLRLTAYGEMSLFKRQNDLGFALEVAPSAAFENRIYYTMHDWTRSGHNDQTDHYLNRRDPYSVGWTGRWRETNAGATARSYSGELGFRYDRPVEWFRPQEDRVFSYSKKLFFGSLSRALSARTRMDLQWQWDSTFESQNPDDTLSAVVSEGWRVDRNQTRLAYTVGAPGELRIFEFAWTHATREWTNHEGRRIAHGNEMPSVLIKWRGRNRGAVHGQLQVGYEVNLFNTWGDLGLTSPLQDHISVEQRLTTGYEFHFTPTARLLVGLNFDMDEWTPVPTFEGGQGRFATDF